MSPCIAIFRRDLCRAGNWIEGI